MILDGLAIGRAVSLTQVREDLLRNGCIKNALVIDSATTVAEIQNPVLSEVEEGWSAQNPGPPPAGWERKLFQAIYMRMVCPGGYLVLKSIDIGSSRRLLVYEYPTCYIAIQVEIGHPENKSLQRFIRRLSVRHALDQEPTGRDEPAPVAP